MKPVKKILKNTFKILGYEIIPSNSFANQDVFINEAKILLKNIKKPLIVDVGAFHGEFSLKIAKNLQNSLIYCFEPQKSVFGILKAKTKNYSNIYQFNYAVAENNDEKVFYTTRESHSSSLLKPTGKFFPEQKSETEIEVKTINLNDWRLKEGISRINLLKLDVQGYELKILESLGDFLQKIDLIFTEVNFRRQYKNSANFLEISNYLVEKGFSMYNIYDIRRLNKIAIFSDALFLNHNILKP